MEKRTLGAAGPVVSGIGLGCMGMSEFYGSSDDERSRKLILDALARGVTFLDTADTYGHGHNEALIADALARWSGEVFVATKFGICRERGSYARTINGRPEYVTAAAEASLRRLRRETIDLYYIHRVDGTVPIEETVGAMSRLVEAGKVRHIGISEASPETVRRAHATHPLTAIQSEYSLWTRGVEGELLPLLRELGIGFVAYSPLGRGFLTGKITDPQSLEEGDFRKNNPRFTGDNFRGNMALVAAVEEMARRREVTPARIALAWLLSRGKDIVPIPGTRRIEYLEDNIAALEISLSEEETARLEAVFAPANVRGARYPEAGMAGIGN